MIVYCEKCGSKFKVDDAKIPEAGVMASCSVCSHRFHLKKEPEIVDLETESIVQQTAKAASATPVPEQNKTFESFAASLFAEPAAPKKEFPMFDGPGLARKEDAEPIPAAVSPLPSAGMKPPAATWDFSIFDDGENDALRAGGPVSVATDPDIEVVAEVAEQYDAAEITTDVQDDDDINDIFSSDPVDIETNPAYRAFEDFLERQSAAGREVPKPAGVQEPLTVAERQASVAAVRKSAHTAVGERQEELSTPSELSEAKPASNTAADPLVRHPVPEIVSDGQRAPKQFVMQKSAGEIAALLDERGLTDEYVVSKVQEVCEATRNVEGVEKPDWPTRILGLDILCKIKGLYPQEKKDEAANRQFQIVTGINM